MGALDVLLLTAAVIVPGFVINLLRLPLLATVYWFAIGWYLVSNAYAQRGLNSFDLTASMFILGVISLVLTLGHLVAYVRSFKKVQSVP
jgi:hypothetical protein